MDAEYYRYYKDALGVISCIEYLLLCKDCLSVMCVCVCVHVCMHVCMSACVCMCVCVREREGSESARLFCMNQYKI